MYASLIILLVVFISMVVFGFWTFFYLHAIQRIENPSIRAVWALCFVVFNIFCIPVYIIMEYRAFMKRGEGGLIRVGRNQQKVNPDEPVS